jgi:hypothetical protein
MRNIISKTVVVLAITAVAAFGADNSIGTWKLNVEKSKYTPGAFPVKSLTTVRESISGGVKATTTGALANGGPINVSVTLKYDGVAVPLTGTGAPYDTVAVKQVDANTFTSETKKNTGPYHGTGRTVISKDGKKMTTTTKGTDADGKPFTSTLVYEK